MYGPRPGVGVSAPHGVGVSAPHGVGVSAPHGVGVSAPHGVGVSAPHGMRSTEHHTGIAPPPLKETPPTQPTIFNPMQLPPQHRSMASELRHQGMTWYCVYVRICIH